jgi:hypothetical protein
MDTFVRLQGRGDILRSDGSLIERVTYRLTLWNPEQDDVTRLLSVDGQIDLSTSDTFKLLEVGGPMTLTLEDGRAVTFTLRSASVRIGGTL